jgi:hypothetical protein
MVTSFAHIVGDHPPLFVIEREDGYEELLVVDTPCDLPHAPSSYPSASSPSSSAICVPWPESMNT